MAHPREDVVRALLRVLVTPSASERSEEDVEGGTMSEADVFASRYMQRVLKGQKRCAQELQALAFEG